MATTVDELPPDFTIPTRNALRDAHTRHRRSLTPDVDTSEGTEPWFDAVVGADRLLPVFAHARRMGQSAVKLTATGDAVAVWGEIEGVPPSEATGAVGLVRVTASTGGGEIPTGTTLRIKGRPTGPRYEVRIGGHFTDGQVVAIAGIDGGQETNQPPDAILEWTQPPPGINRYVTVVGQGDDGTEGLTGGRNAATPQEHLVAILAKTQDPPGAGNDAAYRNEAKKAGVAVQEAFTYPAILGPGVTCVAFTTFTPFLGGSRIPSETQVRIVGEHLEFQFSADDAVLMAMIAAEPVTVAYKVQWQRTASGWADAVPFPKAPNQALGATVVDSATSALSFVLKRTNGQYGGGAPNPVAGQTLAFYNSSTGKFVKKRIASVTGSGPWTIAVETTNNVSDEDYVPVADQRVSPWSDSLNVVAEAVATMFDGLGPGEMVSVFPSDGIRQRRWPQAPERWPHTLTQSLLEGALDDLTQVFDRELTEGDGLKPSVGTKGTLVYMLQLGDLAVYPK